MPRTPQDHLKDLHAELLAATPKDAAARARLNQLTDDVRRSIDATAASPVDAFRGLRERLADAAAGFQLSHPELTKEIESALDTLATHNL